jgi:hypothetical protein
MISAIVRLSAAAAANQPGERRGTRASYHHFGASLRRRESGGGREAKEMYGVCLGLYVHCARKQRHFQLKSRQHRPDRAHARRRPRPPPPRRAPRRAAAAAARRAAAAAAAARAIYDTLDAGRRARRRARAPRRVVVAPPAARRSSIGAARPTPCIAAYGYPPASRLRVNPPQRPSSATPLPSFMGRAAWDRPRD